MASTGALLRKAARLLQEAAQAADCELPGQAAESVRQAVGEIGLALNDLWDYWLGNQPQPKEGYDRGKR